MTLMVLVTILVVAWLVILGPSVVRRWFGAGDGVNSISHFHRQLRVLEHSRGTPIVPPAFRLRSVAGPGSQDGSGVTDGSAVHGLVARPVLTVVGAKSLPRPALAFLGAELPDAATARGDPLGTVPAGGGYPGGGYPGGGYPGGGYPGSGPLTVYGSWRPPGSGHGPALRPSRAVPRRVNPGAHLTALRRRRDTLAVLVLAFMLTLLIGFIPGAGIAWVVTAISGAAMG
ncbi:MAG: hypothetical protein ACYCV7_07580, partial [Acidimicrobiales bacterium]